MSSVFANLSKACRLLSLYPGESGVRPQSFVDLRTLPTNDKDGTLLSFQSVPDKFYFMLFGAICALLSSHAAVRAELVIVRAVSGAVGTGWRAELKRSAPVAWLWSSRWVRAYGDLIDGVAYSCSTWAHPFHDLIDWFRSGPLWLQLQLQLQQQQQQQQQQGEALSLNIEGIEVGDLLVDSYLRFKPSPEFDVKDRFVRRLIWQALRDVRQAQAYFGKRKPRWYLTSYTTYLEHGIPARVALHHDVEVWSFGNLNSFGKRLSRADPFHTQNFAGYRNVFAALEQQAEKLSHARQQLESRLAGGIDSATSYMRKSAYGQSDVELPNDLDGAVVIFLHDFYDSPHVYPELLFQDFWRWICFTIDVLVKTGARFFLKPHPNQITLGGAVLDRLRKQYPAVKWLPTNVSNVQLAQAGIACGITVYGTVAHELAYLGVPSVACARHPHYTFDFCRTARTQKEYERMLESYWVKPVSKAEMQRQALAFYYMHNLYAAGDERELQLALVDFWRASNVGTLNEGELTQAFIALVNLPAFRRFVLQMANTSQAETAKTSRN